MGEHPFLTMYTRKIFIESLVLLASSRIKMLRKRLGMPRQHAVQMGKVGGLIGTLEAGNGIRWQM